MKNMDNPSTDQVSQETIENLREELQSVHDELNRTNSELMQLTIDLDRRVEDRTLELKASEQTLRHINRLLMSIRNINQAIVHEKDRQKLLEEVCEILVEVTGYSFCVVGLLDEGSDELIPVACWGLGGDEGDQCCMVTLGEPCKTECPDTAVVKKKEPIIIGNIGKSKKYSSWKKNAAVFGLKSYVAIPIIHGNSAYGYLAVYSTREGIFEDENEIELLKEVAGDIGMAFNTMMLEEERIRAEKRERHLNDVLRAIRNVNQLIVTETDPERLIGMACENLTQTLGYNSAWIALTDKEGEKVTRVVSSGFGECFNEMRECLERNELPECMRRCLEENDIIVTEKASEECSECPIAGTYSESGGLIYRLAHDGHLYGVITISVPSLYAYDLEELDLFREVAEDLGFALHSIEEAQSLQTHREMLSTAMQLGRLAWWEMELPGGKVTCDDLMLEMLGRDPNDFQDVDFRAFTTLIHPEDYKPAMLAMRDHLEGRAERYAVDYRIQKSDGTWLWLHDSGGIVERDDDGTPRRFAGIVMNIDDRKRAEKELRKSEERLIEAQRIAKMGDYIWNVEAGTVTLSDGLYNLSGYDKSRGIDLTTAISSIHHPEDRERIAGWLGECLSSGKNELTPNEYRLIRKDGEVLFVRTVGKIVHEQDGTTKVFATVQDITERKQAEEDVRKSEEKYRLLADNTLDVIWTLNAQFEFEYINPAIYEMTGYTPEEWIGTNLSDHADEGNFTKMSERAMSEIAKGPQGTGFYIEAVMIRKDGMLFDAGIHGKSVFDEQGEFVILQGVTRDITGRKRVEEALRESEEQYRLLADNTLDVIWTMNSQLQFEYVNPAIYEMTGYTSEEWVGSNLSEHADEVNFARMAKIAGGAIARGPHETGFAFEAVMIKKDGTLFNVEVHAKPVFNEQDDFVILQGVTRDITERKRVEEALRKSEEQYRLLADNTLDVIWIVNSDFEFEYVNPAVYEMTGYTSEEWIGSSLSDHVEEAQFQRLAKLPASQITEGTMGEGIIFTTKMFKKDGTSFDAEIHSKMVFDENGDFVCFQGVTRDVTKKRMAERELAERERLLSFAIEQMPVPVIIASAPDVTISRYNEGVVDMLTVVPESLNDVRIEEYQKIMPTFHPDGTPYTIENLPLIRAIKEGVVTNNEEIIVRQGDTDRWISASAAPLHDENGDIVAGIMIFPEITDIREAQNELYEQDKLLRNIIDTSPTWIFVKDMEGKYILVNKAIAQGYGRSPEDMLGKTDRDFINLSVAEPVDLEKFIQDDRDVIEKQRTIFIAEERFRKPNGDTIWFQTTKIPLTIKEKPEYLLGIGVDITERKKMEMKISEQMAFLQELIDVIPAPVFYKDTDGRYMDCNRAFTEALGYDKQAIIGKTVYEIALKALSDTYHKMDAELLEDGGVQIYESKVRYADSEIHDVIFHKTLFRNLGGEVAGIIGVIHDITDQKRAHEAVRESEEKYRSLVEDLSEGIWVVDDRGYTTFVNSSMAGMLGYEVEEMMGRHFFRFMNEHWRKVYGAMWEKRRDEFFGEHELELLKKDGGMIYAYLNTSPFHDDQGMFVGGMAAVTDVTKRKLAEVELRRSEELFRNVFMHHSAVKLLVDPDTGSIFDANEAAANYYGWPIERLKQMNIQEINTLSPEEVRQEIEKVREGERIRFEFRHRKADGSIRDVEVFSSKIEAKGKELLHSIIHDITDRKQYEEALRTSEAQLTNALRIARAGHWEYDVDTDTFTFNDNFYRIFRTTAEEVGGYRMTSADYAQMFCHPDDVSAVRKEIQEAIETDDPFYSRQLEHRILYDKQEVGHIAVRFFIVKDSRGRTIKTYGVNQDITEQKKLEQQLLQTEKLSSLGGILSGVAHELNNPLTAIIGNAQLLSRLEITSEVKQKLDTIYKESFRCTKIVGGLLAFAREHKPERVMTDINEIIMEAYKLREYELRMDDISMGTELDETIHEISVDPYQIQQVLINLINNAHHALRDGGGGSLMIKSRRKENSIIIECIDDGPGIPDEIKRKIFDPFFTTKEIGMGTGLGLSICYGIVKEHDGSIEVESHPGFGTRFIVSLPVSVGVTCESEKATIKSIPKPDGTITVLVIEDEASLRRFVSDALKAEGYTVTSSESADHAVEILKDKQFDVIVSDMKMPGMSGQNFYTYVQKYHPHLVERIVFITGDVLGKETQSFFRITGCRYVEKPFEIDDLMMVLVELLQNERKIH